MQTSLSFMFMACFFSVSLLSFFFYFSFYEKDNSPLQSYDDSNHVSQFSWPCVTENHTEWYFPSWQ